MGDRAKVVPKQKMKAKFYNSLHERQVAFKHANEWLGVFMTRQELLAWVGNREKENFTDRKLIRDQALDGPRRNAFCEKIEQNTSLHLEDIEISDYFMSDNNGIIAWIHLSKPIVQRILRETSKIPARDFKAVPFLPEISRTKKKAIDQ